MDAKVIIIYCMIFLFLGILVYYYFKFWPKKIVITINISYKNENQIKNLICYINGKEIRLEKNPQKFYRVFGNTKVGRVSLKIGNDEFITLDEKLERVTFFDFNLNQVQFEKIKNFLSSNNPYRGKPQSAVAECIKSFTAKISRQIKQGFML